jgi:phosphoserine phosphatase RsbU/P
VCVPVSSPSIPLGTLWLFCNESREFSAEQTNLIEIIAGRLAADLEREMLLAVGTEAKQRDQELDSAARWQAERLPSVAPLVDGYDVAGWTQQAGDIGGDFHDWSVLADGRLSLVVGDASGALVDAMLGAATLQAAVKAHSVHRHSAGKLLSRVNDSIIAASPGDQRASLAYAVLDPESGTLELALAGAAAALLVSPENRAVIATDTPQLGENPDATFDTDRSKLQPGETLVLISGGVHLATDAAGLRIGEPALASLVAGHLRDSATTLVNRLRRLLDHDGKVAEDMTILVVKRRI